MAGLVTCYVSNTYSYVDTSQKSKNGEHMNEVAETAKQTRARTQTTNQTAQHKAQTETIALFDRTAAVAPSSSCLNAKREPKESHGQTNRRDRSRIDRRVETVEALPL